VPVLAPRGTNDVVFGKELWKAPKSSLASNTLSTRGYFAPKTGSEYYAEKLGKFSTAGASADEVPAYATSRQINK
jgi:hypothetical protein